jgi:hypothetical protein
MYLHGEILATLTILQKNKKNTGFSICICAAISNTKFVGNFQLLHFFRVFFAKSITKIFVKSNHQIRFRDVFARRNLGNFDNFAKKLKKLYLFQHFTVKMLLFSIVLYYDSPAISGLRQLIRGFIVSHPLRNRSVV